MQPPSSWQWRMLMAIRVRIFLAEGHGRLASSAFFAFAFSRDCKSLLAYAKLVRCVNHSEIFSGNSKGRERGKGAPRGKGVRTPFAPNLLGLEFSK